MSTPTNQIKGFLGGKIAKQKTAAVILAAGSSSRMGGHQSKQLIEVGGMPVLARTLLAFERCPVISEIVVVARKADFDIIATMKQDYRITKFKKLVTGGATRQDSAKIGVDHLDASIRYVAIADGARCLVHPEQITDVCFAAYRYHAASAAHRVQDSVKRTDAHGMILETVDREQLWQVQTPQVFHTALYHAAASRAARDGVSVTDDNALIEHLGYQVKLVECGARNLKITTPEDLVLAEAILSSEADKR